MISFAVSQIYWYIMVF